MDAVEVGFRVEDALDTHDALALVDPVESRIFSIDRLPAQRLGEPVRLFGIARGEGAKSLFDFVDGSVKSIVCLVDGKRELHFVECKIRDVFGKMS